MRAPDELAELVEGYLAGLELSRDLGAQRESMRYALEGGKRIRGVICLATADLGEGKNCSLPFADGAAIDHLRDGLHGCRWIGRIARSPSQSSGCAFSAKFQYSPKAQGDS